MPNNFLSRKVSLIIVIPLFLLFFLVLSKVEVSIFTLLLFNISWLAVLITTFHAPRTWVYFFTGLMLFLGFWIKFLFHIQFNMVLIEPVGYWDLLTVLPWQRVLLVSSMIALGLLAANVISRLAFAKYSKARLVAASISTVPVWYEKYRAVVWGIIVVLAVVVNTINWLGKIRVTALAPTWELPLHLNSLVSWIIVFFLASVIAVSVGWDYRLKAKNRRLTYYLVLAIAALTSVAGLSRLFYLFWTLPYGLLIVYYHKDIQKIWYLIVKNKGFIAIYCILAILILFSVTIIRKHYYYHAESNAVVTQLSISKSSHEIKSMIFGRWIGLEGVMATTAYPQAGWRFFQQGLMDRSMSKYSPGIYTSEVLKPDSAHFANDANALLASLPGLGGILNYANTLWLVFAGTFLVMMLLNALEYCTFFAIKNSFLIVQQGLLIAYWCIAGLNIPYNGLIYLVGFLLATLVIFVINRIDTYWRDRKSIAH